MPIYDLLIQGGQVLSPGSGLRGRLDVAIAHGRIAAIAPQTTPAMAAQVVSAQGQYVTPGLIDLHTHLGFEIHTHVVQAEEVCPAGGVTTAVDMGSVGAFTFPWYRERVLSRTRVRLYSFINIASLGTIAIHNPYYVQNYGRYVDLRDTVRMIEENRATIRGIKVFAAGAMVGEWGLYAVRTAVQAGQETGLPVAVHVSDGPPALAPILELLRAGDIMTHTYTPHNQGILDEQGRLRPEVRAARERGVLFDLGHGAGSFTFDVARRALEQGFVPDTFSTDVYYMNLQTPVKDLPTTLSKLLNLGLPLEEVITRATCNPARALREPALGALQVGAPADVAVLDLREGEFTLLDTLQQSLTGRWLLECALTVAGGQIIYRRERA